MDQFKPTVWFAILCFVLLALVPLFDILFAAGGESFTEVAFRATAETGLQWTSNLVVVMRMSMAEPSLLLLLVGSMVPTLAAVVVLLCITRPDKWRIFFGRINPLCGTSIRGALSNYGLIFLVLVPVLLLVLQIRTFTGGEYAGKLEEVGFETVFVLLSIAFLDQGAVLEEFGWRGFAAHELQQTLASPLLAALIIGVFWGFWHLPRDITTGVIERLGIFQCDWWWPLRSRFPSSSPATSIAQGPEASRFRCQTV